MGRAILTDADRVVREDVDGGDLHDRAEPDRGTGVVAEDEEPRTEPAHLRERQTVYHRAHRVLANTEVHVAAAGVVRCQVSRALEGESSLGGGSQVARASDQPGQVLRDRIQRLARRVAAGHSLGITGKTGRSRSHPSGSCRYCIRWR